MNYLTRRAIAVAAASMVAFPVFAEDLVTNERAGLADAPNKLVFALPAWESPSFSAVPAWADGYKKLFQDFISNHKDWQIDFQYQGDDTGQVAARLLEQAKAGNAPDCSAIDSFVLRQFIDNRVLKPMTPYFTKEQVADLFPFIRDVVVTKDGELYAWWWATDIRVLWRNTDVVPTAPKTWADLKQAALASKEKGMEGVLFNAGRWEGTTFDWLANFWSQGGELVDANAKPIFGEGDNRAKMIKAVNYYKDLVDSGAAPKRVLNIKAYDDINAAAAAGTTALFIGGNFQYGQLKNALDPEEFAKWQPSPIPGAKEGQNAAGTGGWAFGSFSNDPKKVAFCAELVKAIYNGPANALQDQLPTQRALFDKYDQFKTPIDKGFAAALDKGKARPGVAIYPEISNQIQIMMGDVLSGTKPTDEAVDAAYKAALSAYSAK
jgi:multiple sugar transport system substrate-binding protein